MQEDDLHDAHAGTEEGNRYAVHRIFLFFKGYVEADFSSHVAEQSTGSPMQLLLGALCLYDTIFYIYFFLDISKKLGNLQDFLTMTTPIRVTLCTFYSALQFVFMLSIVIPSTRKLYLRWNGNAWQWAITLMFLTQTCVILQQQLLAKRGVNFCENKMMNEDFPHIGRGILFTQNMYFFIGVYRSVRAVTFAAVSGVKFPFACFWSVSYILMSIQSFVHATDLKTDVSPHFPRWMLFFFYTTIVLVLLLVQWSMERSRRSVYSNLHYLESMGLEINVDSDVVDNNPFRITNLQRWFATTSAAAGEKTTFANADANPLFPLKTPKAGGAEVGDSVRIEVVTPGVVQSSPHQSRASASPCNNNIHNTHLDPEDPLVPFLLEPAFLELGEKIASGGGGTVYKARYLGKECAAKEYHGMQ